LIIGPVALHHNVFQLRVDDSYLEGIVIVVTGASGQLGRHVIEGLLDTVPANDVVAAVRDPARVEAFAIRGVQVRRADYDEPDTLIEAFWDADRVLLISSNDYSRSAAQHSVAIEAAKRAGVTLLVYTSLTHADTTTLRAAAPHWATEQVIRNSGVPFTVLRNNVYADAFTPFMRLALTSGTLVGSAGDGGVAAATRADYAAAAVAVLTGIGHAGKVYELTADRAWRFADMAAELSKAAGRRIAFQGIPIDQHREILINIGLPALVADVFLDTTRAIAAGEVSETTGQLRALIARPTTTLAELVEQVVNPSKGKGNDHR
jgi:NAD(P)H dehydrogenase (quinone)